MNLLHELALGITAGEASSYSNADFRLWSMLPRRVYRTRALNLLSDERHLTNVARPYVHSNPPSQLQPGPGENLEWFAFSARNHRRVAAGESPSVVEDWLSLAASKGDVRSRLGTRVALRNLGAGLRPPQSGHDNPHYFDDQGMLRSLGALPFVTAGEQQQVAAEVSVTHALDGLWCAMASFELFRGLLDGDAERAVALALKTLPEGTWSRRVAEVALDAADGASGAMERARRLSLVAGDWLYSYPIAAPETLGFLMAHVRFSTSAEDLMLGALQGRNAATLPALAGAAAVLLHGTGWLPSDLLASELRLTGLSLPEFTDLAVMQAIGS